MGFRRVNGDCCHVKRTRAAFKSSNSNSGHGPMNKMHNVIIQYRENPGTADDIISHL